MTNCAVISAFEASRIVTSVVRNGHDRRGYGGCAAVPLSSVTTIATGLARDLLPECETAPHVIARLRDRLMGDEGLEPPTSRM